MANYKAEFFDKLLDNIKGLEKKLTTDKNHNLTRSIENTCHWANALFQTFCDMNDVTGMLAMSASCEGLNSREKKG